MASGGATKTSLKSTGSKSSKIKLTEIMLVIDEAVLGISVDELESKSSTSFRACVNAVVQILFSLRPVRNVLMTLPLLPNFEEAAEPPDGADIRAYAQPHIATRYSVLKALQSCFFFLHNSTRHVADPRQIVNLYAIEGFVHEFEEILQYFCAIITDILMKLTDDFNVIPELLQIHKNFMYYTAEDNRVSYEKMEEMYFFRFKLPRSDIKNIYDSFAERVAYKSRQFYDEYFNGMQKCPVGSKIAVKLPPILFIRLDRTAGELPPKVKSKSCNSKYEFFNQIDVSQFVGDSAVERPSKDVDIDPELYIFTLFAVLTRRRDERTGAWKYAVFVHYAGQGWLRVEGKEMKVSSSEEAIEGNYGTDPNGPVAHALVYIKNHLFDHMAGRLDADEISPNIMKTLKMEKTRGKVPVYKSLMLVTDETLRENIGLNLFQEPGKPIPPFGIINTAPIPYSKLVEVRVGVGLKRFYEIVAHVLNWKANRMRIWVLNECATRENVLRPFLLCEDFLSSNIFQDAIHLEHLLFVERYTYDPIPRFNIKTDILLILKEFDGQNLQYLGCIYAPLCITIQNLLDEITGMEGLQTAEKCRIFHEVGGNDNSDNFVKHLNDLSKTLEDLIVSEESKGMGEILIIEWTNQVLLHDGLEAPPYVKYLKYRRFIEFVHYAPPYETHITEISLKTYCKELPLLMKQRWKLDVKDLRLFECLRSGRDPCRVIRYDSFDKYSRIEKFLPTEEEHRNGEVYRILYLLEPKSLDEAKKMRKVELVETNDFDSLSDSSNGDVDGDENGEDSSE